MKKTVLILIILILVSCAVFAKKKKNKSPEWLNSPKSIYPEQLYLSALGEGDSRTMAENYAIANLAKIFRSKVSADESYIQRYRELTSQDGSSYEDLTEVVKDVNIKADETLYNIQFSDSYTDKYGIVHVIAYLNRFKTGELYEEKIRDNSSSIHYYLEQSNSSGDDLFQYAALSAASVFSNQNETLLDQLLIISPDTYEFLELDYVHEEILKQLAAKTSNIGFDVDISNDEENKISILVTSLLTDLGFVLSEKPQLLVTGSVSFEETDLGRKDNFIFTRYDLQLILSDNESITIAALSENGREGHTNYLEAKSRAIKILGKKIDKNFRNKILGYFDSLVMAK